MPWTTTAAAATPAEASTARTTLADGLRAAEPWAYQELFRRHADHVAGVLHNALGPDDELHDLLHETFVAAMTSAHRLRGDDQAVRGWITMIAVYTARRTLRRRRTRRWTRLLPQPPERTSADASPELSELVRRSFAVLGRMPDEERILFSLRWISQLPLAEIVEASGLSRSTVKRRLARARTRFDRLAGDDALLRDLMPREDAS